MKIKKSMLEFYYETDLNNCLMSQSALLKEVAKAANNPKKYKKIFFKELKIYCQARSILIKNKKCLKNLFKKNYIDCKNCGKVFRHAKLIPGDIDGNILKTTCKDCKNES